MHQVETAGTAEQFGGITVARRTKMVMRPLKLYRVMSELKQLNNSRTQRSSLAQHF
jgi:hypothetical protein